MRDLYLNEDKGNASAESGFNSDQQCIVAHLVHFKCVKGLRPISSIANKNTSENWLEESTTTK